MHSKLLRDIGENAEYVKEIVQNTVEIKKIEAIQASSTFISRMLVGLILTIVGVVTFGLATALAVILLATYLASYPIAILIMIGFNFLLALCFYLLRGWLIKKPIAKTINNAIIKNL